MAARAGAIAVLSRPTFQRQAQAVFDIRNGDLVNAEPIYTNSSIAPRWHYPPVPGLIGVDALDRVDLFVGLSSAIAAQYGGFAGDDGTLYDPATQRLVAIGLGVVRAAAAAYYNIAPGDLNPAETAVQYVEFIPGVGGGPLGVQILAAASAARPGGAPHPAVADVTAYMAAMQAARAAAGGAAAAVVPPAIPASLAHLAHNQILELAGLDDTCALAWLLATPPISADEYNLARHLIRLGAGMPTYQGYNLLSHDHHHLTGKPEIMNGILKEVFGTLDAVPAPLKQAAVVDAVWHKACHPLMIGLKTGFAQDLAVKEVLIRAKVRALAARLPFVPSAVRQARTMALVIRDAGVVASGVNAEITGEPLAAAADYAAAVEMQRAAAARIGPGAVVPPLAVAAPDTRALLGEEMTAQNATRVLEALIQKAVPVAAFAFGLYTQQVSKASALLVDTTRQGGGKQTVNTVLQAYSLSKLRTQAAGAYAAGYNFGVTMDEFKTRKARGGALVIPSITLAGGLAEVQGQVQNPTRTGALALPAP